MKTVILGAGNMGTALAKVLSEKNKVILWTIEAGVADDINENNTNKKYLKNIKLNNNVKATTDLKTALKDCEAAVFAVPSQAIRQVAEKAEKFMPVKAVIINTAKGLEYETSKRLTEVLKEYFKNPIITIGGPSIANELARKKKTYTVYASKNQKLLNKVKKSFETDYYIIEASSDVAGVELCSAFKNVIAIIAGLYDGISGSSNTKAGIITNGLKELSLIAQKLGAEKETAYGLAGLGDLIVTCTSVHSRNRRFGEMIGKGLDKEEAKKRIGQTVEGEKALLSAYNIIRKYKLNAPLFKQAYDIIIRGKDVQD